MKKLYFLILLALLITPVMANPYYTPVIPATGTDTTYYNVSYMLAQNSSTPFAFWLFMALLGLTLLFASFVLKEAQGNDICAIMAPFPILITAWQSLSVDIAGGAGVAAIGGDVTNTWVLLENHIIYSQLLISLFFALLFIVSLLNIYRVWLNGKIIESSEDKKRPVIPPERM